MQRRMRIGSYYVRKQARPCGHKAQPKWQPKLMYCGTILDATLIKAPTSTKNAEKKRDEEMHSMKNGNEWHLCALVKCPGFV